MTDQVKAGWHLDKTVSISHLLTTAIIVVSALAWAKDVDSRIEQNTLAVKFFTQQSIKTEDKVETLRKEIKNDLRDINQKLDRLIEKKL